MLDHEAHINKLYDALGYTYYQFALKEKLVNATPELLFAKKKIQAVFQSPDYEAFIRRHVK